VGHRDSRGVGRARLGLDVQLDPAAGPGELAQLLEVRGCRLPVEHALVAAAAGPDPPTIGTDASTLFTRTVIAAEQPADPILETHRVLLTGLAACPPAAYRGSRTATLVTG
jgi:hypothetical protein